MKIREIIVEARSENNPDIRYTDEPNKVTARVSDVVSQRYTRLANNLRKMQQLSEELKALQEDVKQQRRDDVMSLFNAEDAVITRVVETTSVVLTLSKDPQATRSPQYKTILEALEKHLTPELITVLTRLKEEHVTITQKEPSLRIDVKESNVTGTDELVAKVNRWLPQFDAKLERIKSAIQPSTTVNEASRAERERQKSAQRARELAQQRERQSAEDERLRATAQKKLQKNLPHQIVPQKQQPVSQRSDQGGLGSSALDAYRVDDTIDTDFQGGYYLRFQTDMDGTLAYWSKGDLTSQQALQFKQGYQFSNRFDPIVFQSLIDELIAKSGRGGQPGYVHIEVDKRYLNNPFYTRMYQYLLKKYPQGDYTMDASVGWELV